MAFGTATVLTVLGRALTTNRIKGAGTEPNYVSLGVGATTAARTANSGDSALSTPVESRSLGTSSQQTTTTANDTYQVVSGPITMTSARAIDEMGLFDASTGGNLFLSATLPVINLAVGDVIVPTLRMKFA